MEYINTWGALKEQTCLLLGQTKMLEGAFGSHNSVIFFRIYDNVMCSVEANDAIQLSLLD